MGTPRKMSFTITIDFSLRANYLAYSCAILALYQLIVQSINVPTAIERLQSANEGTKTLSKAHVVVMSPRRLRPNINDAMTLPTLYISRVEMAKLPREQQVCSNLQMKS